LNEATAIEIYNNIGARVLETKFTGETKFIVDFLTRIYYAKINSGEQSIVKKFLVE